MAPAKVAILLVFAALIAVPVVFRPAQTLAPVPAEAQRLIIITPHNEQIRFEFAAAFDRWHERHYGERVNVIWSIPGGTSEIRRMLESQFTRAFETRPSGSEPGGYADLIFGGGSYEHTMLKRGVQAGFRLSALGSRPDAGAVEPTADSRQPIARWEPITQPVDFTDEWLEATYGANVIGDSVLYDPDKFWFGTALSGFGIVYNRDTLAKLDLDEPQSWEDLCDPRLAGWVALVNPGQSGSITTAFDAILQRRGWEHGWRILRRAGANSRYFSASAGKAPRDVSYGNAAMGVCIDFFGRYQSQAMIDSGGGDRVGYIDPPGATTIDPDPISMLRGAPNPVVARRFIEFTLTEEAQALWQSPARCSRESGNPKAAELDSRLRGNDDGLRGNDDGLRGNDDDGFGPRRFELRRLPILRSMYEKHFDRMIDQVNPYEIAAPIESNPNFRAFVATLFAAMVMDTHDDLKRAWDAIINHPAYPSKSDGTRASASRLLDASPIVTADDVTDPTLREMLRLFDAMPTIQGPSGEIYDLSSIEHLAIIREGWLRRGWADEGLWHPEASPADEMRRRFVAFFRVNYQRIVELADSR